MNARLFDDEADRALQRALEIAYAYINRRERTEHEVRAQLERKGVSAPVRERVMAQLIDTRLVDDERYAELFVTDKRSLERWGSDRIRRGLISRGIDRDLAESALTSAASSVVSPGDPADSGDPATELGRALELLRHRFPDPPQGRRERERALGVLLRKGYESDLALDALATYGRDDL